MPRLPARLPARAAALALCTALAACAQATEVRAPLPDVPPMRWDHRPEAALWTTGTMEAVVETAPALRDRVPADIGAFCPGFAEATAEERAAFWTALFSGLARYESTWNPELAAGGGRYRGLMQISPATARHHGCDGADLYDGAENLACAVRIANAAVARDGVVIGAPGDWGGVARDWPPMRRAEVRQYVAEFTRAQPWCQG